MKNIKVSVIIPIYNSKKYLRECIESVQNQTLKGIEIICIDDGSTDSSKEIIETYANVDSRIKYFYQENQGPGPARNKGIKEANGEYISFLDSDDLLKKDTLDTAYKLAIEENLDLVLFNGTPIYESSELEKKHKVYTEYYKRKKNYEEVLRGKELLTKQVNNYDFLPHVGFQLIKKTLITNNNNFFIEALHEDNIFTIKNLLFAEKVFHINKEFYIRRLRKNSIMTSEMTVKNVHGYFLCIVELLNLTKEKEFRTQTLSTIKQLIKGLQRGACKILANLDNEKVEKYTNNLSDKELLLFHLFFDEISIKTKQIEDNKKIIEDNKKIIEDDKKIIEKGKKVIREKNKEIKKQEQEIEDLHDIINNVNKDLKQSKEHIETIKNSNIYKIGKTITFIPRKIKNVFRNSSK